MEGLEDKSRKATKKLKKLTRPEIMPKKKKISSLKLKKLKANFSAEREGKR
jgi:hypothetical protein